MNILVAGRLGRYPERIMTLAERGHRLTYVTMPAPAQRPTPDVLPSSVPQYRLPAGPAGAELTRIAAEHRVDVVYSLKNVWDGSLQLLGELLDAGVGPVVRHHKEHFCEAADLERRALTETAGQIYINQESLDYFRGAYGVSDASAHLLDPDYLPARYFTDELTGKLHARDSEPHLLVAGGVSSTRGRTDIRELCAALSRRRVHVHIYGGKYIGPNAQSIWSVDNAHARAEYARLAESGYVHLHDHIPPERFVAEWSRYDAGLMHVVAQGTHEVGFQRMNRPNRLVPYLAAGLPVAQQRGGQEAMERIVRQEGIGFLFDGYDDLADVLHDRARLDRLGADVLARRGEYTFERHADALLEVFAGYAGRR
ncbi:hypothetical protein ABT008_27090 [Micromonospora sp. NPDC002389]|uniref:hypothetical protein n=1 Tax=Micromonospora sp. NPDC002389 TaxID=3154272 RepID=UPI003330572E